MTPRFQGNVVLLVRQFKGILIETSEINVVAVPVTEHAITSLLGE